jgi:predicted metal-dependent enzyme (double-stranded beta helix superfamily)
MTRFDVEQFADDCRSAMSEGQLAVRDVVQRAVADPGAIERTLGEADGWRIEKLHHDVEMTVLHIIWPPGVDLFAHEHRMWSTVGVYGGREDNTMYRRVGDRVEVVGHKQGRAGDVLLLGVDGIHSVQNPTREWTAAIHVYGGDLVNAPRLQWDKETGDPEPSDLGNVQEELRAAEARARADGVLPATGR